MILNSNVGRKKKYLWNMSGSLSASMMSILLLILVNRIIGEEYGGMFSFAYSHAQLMYTIAVLEVRPLQSTDISEKYKFNVYFSLRVLTCVIMMLLSIIYLKFSEINGIKAYLVMILCFYQMLEAFADSFSAFFQQKDRIDYSGKTATLRAVLSVALFFLTLLGSKNLILSSMAMCVSSLIVFMFYDLRIWTAFRYEKIKFSFQSVASLACSSAPLFVSTFIMMNINNAPKYAINKYCSNVIQNKYNILFMPAFVVNLFSTFAFRPMLLDITKSWENGSIKTFVAYIRRIFLLILMFTMFGVIGAFLLGIPLLSIVYGIDLAGYRNVLIMVMIYGGLNALTVFLYYVIAVMRKQRWMIAGYFIALVLTRVSVPLLVRKYEMIGAVCSIVFIMTILNMILFSVLITAIIKRKGNMHAI